MKHLLSLMLVATMTCEFVYSVGWFKIMRCENKEIICYIYHEGGISCKFKEQEK